MSARDLISSAVGRYVVATCAVAGVIAVYCACNTHSWFTQIVLFVLFVVSRQLRLRVRPSGSAGLSVAGVIGVVSWPLLGPYGALAAFAAVVVPSKRARPLQRSYNVAANAIAIFVGGQVYVALGGPVQRSLFSGDAWLGLLALLVAMAVLFSVNLLGLSGVLFLSVHIPVRTTLRHIVDPATLGQFLFGFIGFMVVQLWLGTLGPIAAILLLLPIVVGQYVVLQAEGDQRVYEATLRALAKVLETKDPYTRGHGERVGDGVAALTRSLDWDSERAEMASAAGLLHDVGKIAIPTTLIRKSGGLSSDEIAAFQLHPLRGVEVVRGIGFLDAAIEGIRHHHERFDGGGYPAGLVGFDIPVVARVIGVVDAYDAMTTARTYRAPLPRAEALAELRGASGSQFDPEYVAAFVTLIESGRFQPAEVATTQPVGVDVGVRDPDDPVPLRPPETSP